MGEGSRLGSVGDGGAWEMGEGVDGGMKRGRGMHSRIRNP